MGSCWPRCWIELRPDVKILANSFLWGIEELRNRCLPVDVFGSPDSASTNLRSARQAFELLAKGHGIAMFPAGEVAHWRSEQRAVTDPPWNDAAARFALRGGARVVPIYFAGANSLAFQIAGLLHPRLRTVRLAGELLNKRGSQVEVRIGAAIRCERARKTTDCEACHSVSSGVHLRVESSSARSSNDAPHTITGWVVTSDRSAVSGRRVGS